MSVCDHNEEEGDDDEDPIVAEVRRAREEIAARFNYDLEAIFEDARRRTEAAAAAGQQVVSLPPRRPPTPVEPARKVG